MMEACILPNRRRTLSLLPYHGGYLLSLNWLWVRQQARLHCVWRSCRHVRLLALDSTPCALPCRLPFLLLASPPFASSHR